MDGMYVHGHNGVHLKRPSLRTNPRHQSEATLLTHAVSVSAADSLWFGCDGLFPIVSPEARHDLVRVVAFRLLHGGDPVRPPFLVSRSPSSRGRARTRRSSAFWEPRSAYPPL
jgi:hypothetical protein